MPRARSQQDLERELGAMEFAVHGLPQTQGSMKGLVRGKRAILVHDKPGLVPWRKSIAAVARAKGWGRGALLDGAIELEQVFVLARPASHFRSDGSLRPDAPPYPHKAPADLDKLERAVGDALTKVVWFDDRRIVSAPHRKVYGDRPGVALRIRRLTPELFDAREVARVSHVTKKRKSA